MPLLHLDSRNREPGSHNGNPTWHLKRGVCFRKLRLLNAVLPHSWYTVSDELSSNTSALQIQLSGEAAYSSVPVSAGIYNLASFATAFQSAVRSLGAPYSAFTCTASTLTYKLTLGGMGAEFSVRILDPRWSALTGIELGVSSSVSTSITGNSQVELAFPHVYITSKKLSFGYDGLARSASCIPPLYTIPVTENAGSVINYSRNSQFDQCVDYGGEGGSRMHASEIDLQLTDPYGNVLDPMLPWTITLEYD